VPRVACGSACTAAQLLPGSGLSIRTSAGCWYNKPDLWRNRVKLDTWLASVAMIRGA